jgi:hypothetical protein
VVVVAVSPLVWLEKLDENLMVVPRRCGDVRVSFCGAREAKISGVAFIAFVFLEVVHEDGDDFFALILHPFDVKINLCTDEVLGGLGSFGGIGVKVVSGTAVTASDDHLFSGFSLNVVEKIDEDRVDELFVVFDGKAMPFDTSTILVVEEGGIFLIDFNEWA